MSALHEFVYHRVLLQHQVHFDNNDRRRLCLMLICILGAVQRSYRFCWLRGRLIIIFCSMMMLYQRFFLLPRLFLLFDDNSFTLLLV